MGGPDTSSATDQLSDIRKPSWLTALQLGALSLPPRYIVIFQRNGERKSVLKCLKYSALGGVIISFFLTIYFMARRETPAT